MEKGSVQAPLGVTASFILTDALVKILGLVCGAPPDVGQSINESGIKVRVQSGDATTRVKVPAMLLVAQLLVAQPFISTEEQKMLGRLL